MTIRDRIYGRQEIIEPILLELIKSQALQRLKGLAQYGIPREFYPFPGYSRFEHSIGVMLLLKKLGADLEEQVAGLLHDVSHPAFSHVIDWVWGNQIKEDYQDNSHFYFLTNSSIKNILDKYKLDVSKIANLENFKLLEREIPFLCADRIDYSLREFNLWANPHIVKKCLENLLVVDHKIVFKDAYAALEFAKTYLKCQQEHWASFEAISRYHHLSKLLKEALNRKILTRNDFLNDDMFVLNKIHQSNQKDLINKLEKMREKITSGKIGTRRKKKFRYVDPEVLINNKIKNLSSIDQSFARLLEKQRQLNEKGVEI